MPIESKAKEVILLTTKKAVDDLQKSNFDGLKRLFSRMISLIDIIPDEVWKKEFKLSALVFGSILGTEDEYEKMDKEKKDRIINAYIDILNSFYKAVEEEDIQKTDDILKRCATVFIDEFAL
jgi:hypothetical protein